jgi:hypothetical protein
LRRHGVPRDDMHFILEGNVFLHTSRPYPNRHTSGS